MWITRLSAHNTNTLQTSKKDTKQQCNVSIICRHLKCVCIVFKECLSGPWLFHDLGFVCVVCLAWYNGKQWSHVEECPILSKQDFLNGRSVTGFRAGLPWWVGSCPHQELTWTKPTSSILPCQGFCSLSRDWLGIAWLFLVTAVWSVCLA